MRIFDGKTYRDMTGEEISAIQEFSARVEAAERHRPLTEREATALLLRQQINWLEVDDRTAVRMTAFYPQWQGGQDYPAGHKVQYKGKLCRCIQSHAAGEGWEPENAPSLWEYINEAYAGDKYDPIPYEGNMALVSGMYYVQNGEVYLCIRDTVNPVYNPLAELTGQYTTPV